VCKIFSYNLLDGMHRHGSVPDAFKTGLLVVPIPKDRRRDLVDVLIIGLSV